MKANYILLLIVLLGLATQTIQAQSPLEILQISGAHKDEDIRSQFKKLALKYHPARLQEFLPEEENGKSPISQKQKQTNFFSIAQAYIQLAHDKQLTQTKLEDILGADNSEKYANFFYSFFSDTGSVCNPESEQLDCKGGKPEKYAEDPFFESKTINFDMITIGQYFQKSEVWLLFAYPNASKYPKTDTIVKVWRTLGKKNKDMYLVAGLDCKIEPEICTEVFEIKDLKEQSSLSISPGGEQKSLLGFVTSVENITGMAMKVINEIEIDELYTQNYPQNIKKAQEAEKQMVVMFTEKHQTPKSLKIIASKFKDYFHFVTVGSKNTAMVEKFAVKTFPSLIVIPDPTNVNTGEFYTGDMKKKEIINWLMNYRTIPVSEFEEYTEEIKNSGNCSRTDFKFCLFLNLQGDLSKLEQVKHIPAKFNKSPIRFYYVNQGFQEELENEAGFVFIKSKRIRYGFKKFTETALDDFVDSVLQGATLVAMPGDVYDKISYGNNNNNSQQQQKVEDL